MRWGPSRYSDTRQSERDVGRCQPGRSSASSNDADRRAGKADRGALPRVGPAGKRAVAESWQDSAQRCGGSSSRQAESIALADPSRSNLMSTGGRPSGFSRRCKVQFFLICASVQSMSPSLGHHNRVVPSRAGVARLHGKGAECSVVQADLGVRPAEDFEAGLSAVAGLDRRCGCDVWLCAPGSGVDGY